jgi:hypothetical protein
VKKSGIEDKRERGRERGGANKPPIQQAEEKYEQ